MTQSHIISFILAAILLLPQAVSALPRTLKEAIDTLDHHLQLREHYIENRHKAIDAMKHEMALIHTQDPTLKYEALGNAFRGYIVDSAMFYFEKGIESARANGHKELEKRLTMQNAETMTFYGLFKEAIESYESIDTTSLDTVGRMLYFRTGSNIYLQAYDFYPPPYKEKYRKMAVKCLENTMPYYRNSVAIDLTNAQIKILNGENALSLADLSQAFPGMDMSKPEFAITTSLMADFYKQLPSRHDDYLYYLALSATSDIIAATCETTSLQSLGIELYRKGDIARANKYISTARENTLLSGARIRAIDNDKIIAEISREISQREDRRTTLLIMALGVAIAIIILFAAMFIRKKRLSDRQAKRITSVSRSNALKDTYIRQLLTLCSVYIEGLEDFNRLATRKLKAGQVQDLFQLTESGKILQENADKFHTVFDESFLEIYPTFIDDLNALLLPDKKIVLTQARTLTPELRITAFMRIGVDDSAQISKFLGLSLNTVYTYRNRMKARAIDRENFEANIKKIGSND